MLRTQVKRVGRQAVLLLRGLGGAYVAIGSFASGSLISIIGAALGAGAIDHGTRIAVLLAMIAGILGVSGLVFACFHLFLATYLSMLNMIEEAALIRQRQEMNPPSKDPGWRLTRTPKYLAENPLRGDNFMRT